MMSMTKQFRLAAVLPCLAVMSCAGLQGNGSLLQPQTTMGQCSVKPFYLVGLVSTHTDLSVEPDAQTCQFTLINPDQQIVNDAALVTPRPAHGVATASLIVQGRSILVSYLPSPGYVGADSFEVTVQPRARGVTFTVSVEAPPPRR